MRFSLGSTTMAAALLLLGGGAVAAPAAGNGLHPQPDAAAQAGQKKTCAQTLQPATDADGGATQLGPPSAAARHVQAVLGEDDSADIDGVRGPCRLVDADIEVDEFIVDGTDVAKLLKQIDELLALDQAALDEQGKEEEALALGKRRFYTNMDDDGQALRTALFGSAGRTVPDVSAARRLRDWDDIAAGRRAMPPLYRSAGANPAALDNPAGGPAAMTPVPEPSSYAMLLAGMLALGALALRRRATAARRRVSDGKGRPAARR
ncbi:PEP-CTERM sorting domain-containing protein [Janthinobacterium fluminis]|uniref:PEP-CTERM sorting domain-containing protein n=1 Tax=Janthinobacterium fluminis TaxID=2987524 RepID=A0ABT5JY11_9BURK|nr:PEP-CTERM sorting domain-containing protein [Janthinobacterium fluminis]MDC8757625.1 PEP-CTERM sorting domain-containing protein [Janthinobacterium fluminis]